MLKQWKFVARLNWMGAKQKKYKIWAILAIFGPFGPPCWAPRGIRSHLSFSTTLSALYQCKNNTIFLPEWNGWWQNLKNSRFWSILAIFGTLGPPWGPLGALHPSFWKLYIFSSKISSKWDQPQVSISNRLEVISHRSRVPPCHWVVRSATWHPFSWNFNFA